MISDKSLDFTNTCIIHVAGLSKKRIGIETRDGLIYHLVVVPVDERVRDRRGHPQEMADGEGGPELNPFSLRFRSRDISVQI